MALIIEDGTGLVDAESFATVVETQAYATARGLTFPTAEADAEILLRNAAEYLLGIESQFKGSRTFPGVQRLTYPRTNAKVYGVYLESDDIPEILKEGQMQLASDFNATAPTDVGNTEGEIKLTEVGPIKKEFFESGSTNRQPRFNKAMDILAPLLKPNQIVTNRV